MLSKRVSMCVNPNKNNSYTCMCIKESNHHQVVTIYFYYTYTSFSRVYNPRSYRDPDINPFWNMCKWWKSNDFDSLKVIYNSYCDERVSKMKWWSSKRNKNDERINRVFGIARDSKPISFVETKKSCVGKGSYSSECPLYVVQIEKWYMFECDLIVNMK